MGQRTQPDAGERPEKSAVVLTAVCTAALTLLLLASSTYFRGVSTPFVSVVGLPHSLTSLFSCACFALLAAASYLRPQALLSRGAAVGGVAVGILNATLIGLGYACTSAVPFLLGAILHELLDAWALFLFACLLARLASLKEAAVTAVGGVVLRQLALPLTTSVARGLVPSVVASSALLLAVALAVRSTPDMRALARCGQASLGELEVTNPLSSLWPPPLLFAGIFAVSLTYEFTSNFGIPALGTGRTVVVLAMFAVLYLLLIQHTGQEDHLFSLCVLLIMAGLLLTPVFMDGDTFISHTCLFLGRTCFSVLVWLLAYGVGRRNVAALMPAFCLMEGMEELGGFAGCALGGVARSLLGTAPGKTQTIVLLLALAFFAFVWLAFRRFSFTEAIQGIEATPAPDPAAGTDSAPEDPHEQPARDCRGLAAAHGLTPREAEVLELLARGRNARFIMENLGVTRNTAKAHIGHIYTKLGVHSHQELLSLIEDGGEGEDRARNR